MLPAGILTVSLMLPLPDAVLPVAPPASSRGLIVLVAITVAIGMLIFFVLMAEAFAGYLLPWGQMSYWGAQVIVNLFTAIPFIGEGLAEWIRGDFFISDITLNRFFALHVIAMPLVLVGLVVVHILALHEVGSNNPDGVEIKDKVVLVTGGARRVGLVLASRGSGGA